MFPMIAALLIAIAVGGSGAHAMPNSLPGRTSYAPETRQVIGQMAREEALAPAPGVAKTAVDHAEEACCSRSLAVAPAPPSSAKPAAPEDNPRRSPVPSSTTAVTLTQTISDVLKLADDPLISGRSYRGLLAKLEAADRALDRGQAQVAVHVLDAFHNQLNAFQRSGHITAQNYDDLLSRYSALVASLGGVARARTEPTHGSDSGAGADAAASQRGDGRKAGQPSPHRSDDKGPKRR